MRPRTPNILAVTTVAAIVVASILPFTAAAGAPPKPEWLPELRDSAGLSGPVLVEGQLVDSKGAASPGRVTAIAWPTMAVLGGLQPGDQVKRLPVGKGVVGRDGRFALRIDPTVPIGEFMEPDGTVNFDLMGDLDGRTAAFSFPRRLDGAATAWVPRGWNAKAGPPETLKITLPLEGIASLVPENAVRAPEPLDKFPCTDAVIEHYDQRVDTIGEVYTGPHATGDFEYLSSSSSELGIGVSSSGTFGTYSASGTASISSTSTINFPTQAANKRFIPQSTFRYTKYHTRAWTEFGCIWYRYVVRVSAFQGGVLGYQACCTAVANNCSAVTVVPATLTKQSAAAVTFTNGLDIDDIIGVNLSTKTGFNTRSQIKFTFTSAGSLCGSDAAWPDASRIVGK